MKNSVIMFGSAALAFAASTGAFAADAYIESTASGKQAINTGYYINSKTKIEIDFQMTSIVSQSRLFGQNGDGCGNYAVVYFGDSDSNFKVGYGNTFNGALIAPNNLRRNKIIYDGPNDTCRMLQDGNTVATANLNEEHGNRANFPMAVFAQCVNAAGTSFNNYSCMRLYGLKVYEDGKLVRNLSPCLKGGVAGLRDSVTGDFLYDTRTSGAGSFSYGGDIQTMAEDPYVASNGTGAINLGIGASPKLKVELDYALTDTTDPTPDSTSTHYQQRLFGQDSNSETPRMAVYINASKNISIASGDGFNATATGIAADLKRHKAVIDGVANRHAFMTGITTNWSASAVNVTKCALRPLALFGDTTNDDGTTFSHLAKAKVYGLKIWAGGTLIRDLAPRRINGTAGFEDLVTGRFYTCGGLTASSNAPTSLSGASREGDAFVESDGSFFSVVNTYYFVKPQTKIVVDFALASVVSGAGVLGGYGANAGISTILWCNGTSKFELEMHDGNHNSTADNLFSPAVPLDLARHTAVFDGPGRRVTLSTHGGTVEAQAGFPSSWTLNATKANWPVMLFGFATDAYGHSQQRCKARIYSVKFYENGSIVEMFTPAVKGGVAGFKDINGKFFSGDGLIAGGKVDTIVDDSYVENTSGGCYFDTGYYVTSNTCVKIDYMPLVQQNGQQFPFEAGNSGGAPAMYMRTYGNGSAGQGDVSYACGQSGFTTLSVPYAPHVRRKVTVDAYNLKARVETSGKTIREATIPSTGRTSARSNSTLKLLCNAAMTANSCKARLYGVQIYEKGTLVRDYVPICQVGTFALLDTKSGTILEKAANSGDFAGHTRNNDLDESFFYAPMRAADAYIESDGTQAINLGYYTTPETRYEIDYQLKSIVGQSRPFGEATGSLSAELYIQGSATGSGNVAFGVGDTWKGQYTNKGADLNRHVAVLDLANRECGYSGYKMFAFGDDAVCTKKATYPMWLFAKGTGANGSHANRTAMRLYAFRIYEAGVLKHEYLPYKNGSVVGLYDTVARTVKVNSVSGGNAFVYGGGPGYGKFAGPKTPFAFFPGDTTVTHSHAQTLSAFAAGAVAYKWTKNGKALSGGANGNLTVTWAKGGAVDTYTVTAVFLVNGAYVDGGPATFTVANALRGTMLSFE